VNLIQFSRHLSVIQYCNFLLAAYTQCLGPVLFCSSASVVVCNTPRTQRNSPAGSTRRRASSVTSR